MSLRSSIFLVTSASLACLLFSSCASKYPGYKRAPYTIRGQRYYPLEVEEALVFREEGVASWYDERRFFGLKRGTTALGESFRPGARAGAHKTLPLPCKVRVTNLENGRTTVLRLNDRGPFISGRILDVTPAVAHDLGFRDRGLTKVRIEVISVGDGRYEVKARSRRRHSDHWALLG